MANLRRGAAIVAVLAVVVFGFGVAAVVMQSPAIAGVVPGNGYSVSDSAAPPAAGWTVGQLTASPSVNAPYDEPGLGMAGAVYLGAPSLRTSANPTGAIDVLVTLSFSNASKLNTLLAALVNPASPQYHHYLTATEFDEQFGASPAVYNSLVNYLASFGVTGLTTHPDRLALSFEATPAQVKSIFRTPLGAYLSPAGLPFYAPLATPQLPDLLAPYIVDVEGLSNFSEYQNHLAPLASLETLPSALAGDAATGGAIPAAVAPATGAKADVPGGAHNPFASTTVTSNGLTNTYDQPVILNLKGKTGTCDTNNCGDLVQAPDLQVAYNETGLFKQYGYPVNATVAAILWSDTACHADSGTCSADGYYNYYCSTLTSGNAAWDFFMPDVTSFWNYSIPAGEPMPRAVSMPITGYTYAYPAGSKGYSASCDDAGAEGENTLDVDMLGSMAPGANVFQVFGGSSSSTAIDTVFTDILSPTSSVFSATGGFDTAANLKDLTNVSVISNSWTTTGTLPAAWTTDLKTAAARGITVLGATGDSGTTLAPPAEIGANTYGTVAVGGTTAAINATTLVRGAPHLASASAPYYGVGRGEIGWYEPSGKVDGFTSTYGGTGGVASSTTYYRASWFNASSDAVSVANAVRSGNYRAEPDIAAIANDTIVDLDEGAYSLNMTCWVSSSCTAISSLSVGTTSGSSPTIAATYFIGTSVATQVLGGEIATIDHGLYTQHEGWLGYLNPAAYPMGQKQDVNDLTLKSFYDVNTYTDGGGLTANYEAKAGYDLATGWGVIDAGNYSRNTMTYAVTFTESGLPSGTSWSVALTPQVGSAACTLSGSTCTAIVKSSTTTTIVFNEPFGTYGYKLGLVPGYAPTPSSGSVKVNGAPVGVGIAFTQVTYSVTFTESGLPSGTSWTVTLAGAPESSTGTSIVFTEPNGTFGYSVAGVPGYAPNPASGSVTVSGASKAVGISFSQVTYTVEFSESGLPSGETFAVTFHGTPESLTTDGGTDSLLFSAPNGTFAYAIANVDGWQQSTLPASGSVTVAGASVVEPTLVYTGVPYSVTFTQSGLPSGTEWTVTLAGVPQSSTGGSISFEEPNGTYGYTVAPVPGYNPISPTGSLTVAGSAVEQPVPFAAVTYAVTISESGLPAGETFQVTVNGTVQSTTTDGGVDSLGFSLANGTYPYSIGAISGYSQSTLPATGDVVVDGAAVAEPTLAYTQVVYSVSFSESGLPSGTAWAATLDGSASHSTGATIAFYEPNGTFAYNITPVAGYTADPSAGTVVVDGTAVSVAIAFSPYTYAVTFSESGLPMGQTFGVTLNGVPESLTTDGGVDTLAFAEANGSYAYAIAGVAGWSQSTLPGTGSVTVDGAAVAEPTLAYTQVTYSVTFTESGLPSGTAWSVTLNGTPMSSSSASIAFTEPNGSFPYTVAAVPGYTPAPASGSVTVNGGAASVAVSFSAVTYAVTFTESGLPSGTSWSITLNGDHESSTTSAIVFSEANGTYDFTVGHVAGYVADPVSGSVTVDGAAVSTGVAFSVPPPGTYAVTFTEGGLPAGTSWSVSIGGTPYSSTGATIAVMLTNGTYSYTVGAVAGYVASPASGSFTVNGAPVSESVSFTPTTYTVTFSESGLPAGKEWAVAFNGVATESAATTISFSASDGTYLYLIQSEGAYWAQGPVTFLAPEGNLTVNGQDLVISVEFVHHATVTLTFKETGVASGTSWCVTVGAKVCTTASKLQFKHLTPAGYYEYSVGSVGTATTHVTRGHVAVPASAWIAFSKSLTFKVAYTYPVTFTETGLPSGTEWKVTAGSVSGTSTTDTIVLYLTNGSYTYHVVKVTGYTAAPTSGHLTVAGAAQLVSVTFTTNAHHGTLPGTPVAIARTNALSARAE